MSIVKINRRRIYIPKEIPFTAKKAMIIPLGTNLLIVPVFEKPIEIESPKDAKELRKLAEKKAKKEALSGGD